MTLVADSASAPQPALQLTRSVDAPRVLHLVPSLYGGGMERSLLRLITGASKTRSDSDSQAITHGVCILKQGAADLVEQSRSAAQTWVLGDGAPGMGRWTTWRRLRDVIWRFEPDILHARTTAVWFDAAFALRKHPRIRLLLSYHGRTSFKPTGRVRRRINRWACAKADAVMTVSCEAARMLESEWGIPARKIRVIFNGVDTERFSPPQRHRTVHAGLPARTPADHIVACIANFLPIKGLDMLLRSWRRVVMADRRAKLWLIGDGPLRGALTQLADVLRLGDHVEFLGRREDVPDLLRAADLFVLPSQYEASSNAALEAMATGLPIVAFDVGGMRELIRPNHTGWLVPAGDPDHLADTVLSALIDRSARQRVGQAARRAVIEEHTLADWIDRYTSLYHSLAEGGRPACAE